MNEQVATGIAIVNGTPMFTCARFQLHLERAGGNVAAAIHDMLAAAYQAEEQTRASVVRGA